MAYRTFMLSCRKGAYVGSLGRYVADFALYLRDRGYSVWTAGYYLGVAGELSRWLKKQHLGISDLGRDTLASFLRSRRHRVPLRSEDRSGLRRLLDFLRERRLIPRKGPRAGDFHVEGTRNTGGERELPALRPIDLRGFGPVERAYERYLAEERGLVSTSRRGYLLYVRRFLSEVKVASAEVLATAHAENGREPEEVGGRG